MDSAITVGPELGFQPGTVLKNFQLNVVLNDEGMGGYLNYLGVCIWLAKHSPWVHGRVWVENFLVPIVRDVLAPYKHWQALPSNQFSQLKEIGVPVLGCMVGPSGQQLKRELLTAIGTHPFDIGFAYFASTCPAPKDALLPVLDYPLSMITEKFSDHKVRRLMREAAVKGYVVFTAGGTTPIRTLTGEHLRPLVAHVKAKGFTPVYLGKHDILADGKLTTKYIDDMDYSDGIDLRDKTTVREAACIMQHAKCTVGLDGGLLHLACLMRDSRVVFGYNITTIADRIPHRNHGRTVNVALSRDELPCTGCQSSWKNMLGHSYDKCFYEEGRMGWDASKPERARACLRLLFANDSIKFKNAIDEVLCG